MEKEFRKENVRMNRKEKVVLEGESAPKIEEEKEFRKEKVHHGLKKKRSLGRRRCIMERTGTGV